MPRLLLLLCASTALALLLCAQPAGTRWRPLQRAVLSSGNAAFVLH